MRARRRLRQCLTPFFCPGAVALALSGYLTALVGFPVLRSTSQVFPTASSCSGRSCGCSLSGAHEHCCCSSPTPEAATAAVSPRRVHEDDVSKTSVRLPCCGQDADVGASPQDGRQVDPAPSACTTCSAGHSDGTGLGVEQPGQEQPRETAASTLALSWILGMQARACKGLATLWISLGGVLPPSLPLTWSYEWSPAGWLRPTDSELSTFATAPPEPPPRSS